MTRRLQGRAGSLIVQVAMGSVICVGFYVSPTFAQTTCPATPSELEAIIDNETDPEVRAEAAECFVEKSIDFSYPELKQLVHMMLKEEEPADVRFHGLAILGASLMAGESTGSDLWGSKSKIIKILKEDPIGQNKAAAAALISYMDPIPENQVEEPLLDLLSHFESSVASIALGALLAFDFPPEQEISDALMGKMEHSDPKQRGMASRGFGLLHRSDPSIDPAVIDALAIALSDSDRHVKIQAANSLRMFGSQAASAAPDLNAIVWDPKQPPDIRKVAQKAEETITGQPTQPPWLGETSSPQPGMAGGSQ